MELVLGIMLCTVLFAGLIALCVGLGKLAGKLFGRNDNE
jgi:hypothetical protein